MELMCGPEHDKRKFSLSLPTIPNFQNSKFKNFYLKSKNLPDTGRIGVLVSGGVDSAILYFTLLKENIAAGNKWKIIPYTILRKEGSRNYAKPVINWVHNYFNIPTTELNLVGDNNLPEIKQVSSGIIDIIKNNIDYVYLGIIESRPEHSIGWARPTFVETSRIKYPLLHLQKSHVIDIYRQLNVLDLLSLTHSCAVNELVPCGTCNGCNERTWGLNQLGL